MTKATSARGVRPLARRGKSVPPPIATTRSSHCHLSGRYAGGLGYLGGGFDPASGSAGQAGSGSVLSALRHDSAKPIGDHAPGVDRRFLLVSVPLPARRFKDPPAPLGLGTSVAILLQSRISFWVLSADRAFTRA